MNSSEVKDNKLSIIDIKTELLWKKFHLQIKYIQQSYTDNYSRWSKAKSHSIKTL